MTLRRLELWFRVLRQPRYRMHVGIVLAVALLIPALDVSVADASPASPRRLAAADREHDDSENDESVEAAAIELVDRHLPELRGVLRRLKSDEPKQYRRAIADLARSARRLESAQRRDSELYEIELEHLQARTTLDLLSAKLKVRDSARDRRGLRQALARVHDAERKRAQYDVASLTAKLQRTQQQLDEARQRLSETQPTSETEFEAKYQSLLHRAGREPNRKSANEPKPVD